MKDLLFPSIIALASSFQFAYAQKNVESKWVKHVIKPPRPTTKDNTIPNIVWVHDVDGDKDGKKDLIGQGYQPFHNGNKWYKCPDNQTGPWNEWHDYGVNLKNGHDIRLRGLLPIMGSIVGLLRLTLIFSL